MQRQGRRGLVFAAAGALLLAVMSLGPLVGESPVRFTDVTRAAGIRFVHNTGAFGKRFLPETMGAGCAFLDFNNDGWQDIFLVNSMDFPGHRKKRSRSALYQNNGDGTFRDVTVQAGLNVELYGMGVAVGDYDNDGNEDLYVTALGSDRLFHNEGNGKFRDATKSAGVDNPSFGAGAAWLDYDRDGHLDLFVTNYVKWSEKDDIYCSVDGANKSYCTPELYKGDTSRMFRNLGDGRFEDVTVQTGLLDPHSKSLGVVVTDYDRNGWPDLIVANDTEPNRLYQNDGNGTFSEQGIQAGIAFSEDGVARGAMGIDAADYDLSGYPSIAIANFSNEMLGLYHNEGNRFFIDEAPTSTVGRASLLSLSFGLFFFDYDLDGLPDLFVVNGHIEPDMPKVQPQVSYEQLPLLFRNVGKKQFHEEAEEAGFSRKMVGRGAAYADYDNDGDLDVLVTTNGGPAILYRNDGGNANRSVRFKVIGTSSNRSGFGTTVRLYGTIGVSWQMVRSGSSYCSQSEMPVTFGLGANSEVGKVELVWPSGQQMALENLAAGFTYTVEEGRGVVNKRAFRR